MSGRSPACTPPRATVHQLHALAPDADHRAERRGQKRTSRRSSQVVCSPDQSPPQYPYTGLSYSHSDIADSRQSITQIQLRRRATTLQPKITPQIRRAYPRFRAAPRQASTKYSTPGDLGSHTYGDSDRVTAQDHQRAAALVGAGLEPLLADRERWRTIAGTTQMRSRRKWKLSTMISYLGTSAASSQRREFVR